MKTNNAAMGMKRNEKNSFNQAYFSFPKYFFACSLYASISSSLQRQASSSLTKASLFMPIPMNTSSWRLSPNSSDAQSSCTILSYSSGSSAKCSLALLLSPHF